MFNYSKRWYREHIRNIIKAPLQACLPETKEMQHIWKGHPFQNVKIYYFLLCTLQYHLEAVCFYWHSSFYPRCYTLEIKMCVYLSIYLSICHIYLCIWFTFFTCISVHANTITFPSLDCLLSKKDRSIKGERKEVLLLLQLQRDYEWFWRSHGR